jgi:hypothetical protein
VPTEKAAKAMSTVSCRFVSRETKFKVLKAAQAKKAASSLSAHNAYSNAIISLS